MPALSELETAFQQYRNARASELQGLLRDYVETTKVLYISLSV